MNGIFERNFTFFEILVAIRMTIFDASEPGNDRRRRHLRMSRWRVGVDSGGTFTDICLFEEDEGRVEVWKVSSTPDDPSRGIAQGVEEGMRRVAVEAGDRPAAAV